MKLQKLGTFTTSDLSQSMLVNTHIDELVKLTFDFISGEESLVSYISQYEAITKNTFIKHGFNQLASRNLAILQSAHLFLEKLTQALFETEEEVK